MGIKRFANLLVPGPKSAVVGSNPTTSTNQVLCVALAASPNFYLIEVTTMFMGLAALFTHQVAYCPVP